MSNPVIGRVNRSKIDQRQIDELIGLSQGLLADGVLDQIEAEFLYKWLAKNKAVSANPIIGNLFDQVTEMLMDGVLSKDESRDLFETLEQFSGGNFGLGELQKSTSLPIDAPPPKLDFKDRRFCFTGTFLYGTRKECTAAVTTRGGSGGSLTKDTDFLVIGIYATDSWVHSSYGRKIEKALEMKNAGSAIAILGEAYWSESL
jgi:NAD-dependent DNA ligase